MRRGLDNFLGWFMTKSIIFPAIWWILRRQYPHGVELLLSSDVGTLMLLRKGKRRRQWHPTPVLLLGKSHGRRSLEGCGPWGRWGSDTTERLHFHFSLSCIGEGNGSPLQCFCLENLRDRGAWWAAVYGVAQSRTRLKWLSSGSIHLGCYGLNCVLPKCVMLKPQLHMTVLGDKSL